METKSNSKPVILVTGSAGLIGTRVVEEFARDYQVVGLDVKPPKKSIAEAQWTECDFTDDASVVRTLATIRERQGGRLASVIHLAAYYDFSGEPSPLYQELTVNGTHRLLDGLQQFEVEQFVFSSTLLVMKPAEEEDQVITETSPIMGDWDYPRSKIEAEEVIKRARREIPVVVLRMAGVYTEDCQSIPIAQQISRIYEKQFESYFFPGDADHGQPFVHLEDLVGCLRRTVESRRALGPYEVFLIAEPDLMGYGELQDRLGELIHGKEWPTIRIPKAVAKVGAWAQGKIAGAEETFIKPWMVDLADAHYPVAIARAREKLGWEPTRRLRDTLEEMVHRLKRDPQQWYKANKLTWPEQATEKG